MGVGQKESNKRRTERRWYLGFKLQTTTRNTTNWLLEITWLINVGVVYMISIVVHIYWKNSRGVYLEKFNRRPPVVLTAHRKGSQFPVLTAVRVLPRLGKLMLLKFSPSDPAHMLVKNVDIELRRHSLSFDHVYQHKPPIHTTLYQRPIRQNYRDL